MDFLPIINSILSLAVVMALGIVARKTGVLKEDHKPVLSAYIYYFALPALFCAEIAGTDFLELELKLFTGSVLPVAMAFGLLVLLHLLKLLNKDRFVITSLTVVFGSNAFFGVAFFQNLWGEWGFHTAVLAASILGMIGVTASLFLFEYATSKGKAVKVLARVMKSPVILAIGAGLVLSLLQIKIPLLINGLSLLGRTAAGVAIFLLGMFLYDNFSLHIFTRALGYSLLRVILLPCGMLLSFYLMGELSAELKQFLLLQTGIPVAISVAVFAHRYEYHTPLLSGIVVLTSLLSFLSLSLLYFLAQAV